MITPASLVETRARRVRVSGELFGEGEREGGGGEPGEEEGEIEKGEFKDEYLSRQEIGFGERSLWKAGRRWRRRTRDGWGRR